MIPKEVDLYIIIDKEKGWYYTYDDVSYNITDAKLFTIDEVRKRLDTTIYEEDFQDDPECYEECIKNCKRAKIIKIKLINLGECGENNLS